MPEGGDRRVTPGVLRDAIVLARRAGWITAEAAHRASTWLDGCGEAEVPLGVAAERLGRPTAGLQALVDLTHVLPASATVEAMAETLQLRASAEARLAEDLLARAPAAGDASEETLRLDPALPMRAAAAPEASPAPSGGATPVTRRPTRVTWRPNIPRALGPYRLLEELGHGGMGIVFRATHESLGTPCAVKVLIAGEHASPEEIERFKVEARSVARMGKHPNIVAVYDLDTQGSITYYAMELVVGKALSKVLREREEPFAPHDIARLMEKVARAVQFAHAHRIIHRDLKPDNIVIREAAPSEPGAEPGASRGGEPQVMDFGLARDVSSTERLSVRGQVMGSPNYMSPEQARGDVEGTDARTDVYGLGAVLYEVLTGFPPHPGRALHEVILHVLRGEVLSPRRVRPDIPRDLETICLKCLDPVPSRRYVTAEALAEDLARFQRGEPVHARPVGRLERFVRRVRRHPLVSGLLAILVIAAAALAWYTGILAPARVSVTTFPPDARVDFLGAVGWQRSLRPWHLVWPARSCYVRVTAPGFETAPDVPVIARPLGVYHVDVALHRDCGGLAVDSEPPGAEIQIDHKPTGSSTPQESLLVTKGDHLLTLTLPDHEPYHVPITIHPSPAPPARAGRITLRHEQGRLELTGSPPGLSVSVYSGDTEPTPERRSRMKPVMRLSPPATVSLDTGSYWLLGQLDHHFECRRGVTLRIGGTARANLSVHPQRLWSRATDGVVWSSPALGDVDQDGVLDCVVGSFDKKVYAMSGRDGSVLWTRELGELVWASPALGDVNLDGVLDCVIVAFDKTAYAMSGRDGSVLWSRETGGVAQSSPALGDLNGDGVTDCVVGGLDKKVYALSGRDGSVLWAPTLGGAFDSSPALGDLNEDGVPDAVVGSYDKKVYALSGRDGAVLWSRGTGGQVHSSPALGDVNGDGVLDCVVGSDDWKVSALSGRDGSVLWAQVTGGKVGSSPALGDVNGDGVLDCLVGSADRKVYALSGRDGSVLWLHSTGGEVSSSPSLGDVNLDGVLDCVVGSLDKSVYALSGRDGSVLWTFETGGGVYSSPALGDVDGDGALDCVVGSYDRKVWAISGWEGSVRWAFETGGEVYSSPAPGDMDGDGVVDCVIGSMDGCVCALSGQDGTVLWTFETGGEVHSSPALGDLNGDGALDCVVGSDDKRVYALSGRDASILWCRDTGQLVLSSPALADLSGDGVLDCVVGSMDKKLYVLSGRDGTVLWTRELGGFVSSSPAVGDVNGDGQLDCVVGAMSKRMYALSGRGGSVLWDREMGGGVESSPALGDVNGDGTLDGLVGCLDKKVYALSGHDGSVLWARETGGEVWSSPTLGDVEGDGGTDCVVGSDDKKVYALSGRDGTILWSRETGDVVRCRPALGDLDGDRRLDCVVGSWDERVYALSGRDGSILWARRAGGRVRSSPALRDMNGDGELECMVGAADKRVYMFTPGDVLRRLASRDVLVGMADLRRQRSWGRLADVAAQAGTTESSPWRRSVALRNLGVARLRLGDAIDALDALAGARGLGLRAPDGAVYEWVASQRCPGCPADRCAGARQALLEALALDPETVFDTLIDVQDLVPDVAKSALRQVLLDSQSWAPIEASLLMAVFAPEAVPKEALSAARETVLARWKSGGGQVARLQGYLALLAHALGEERAFSSLYAAYLDQSRRPESLDRLLASLASAKR